MANVIAHFSLLRDCGLNMTELCMDRSIAFDAEDKNFAQVILLIRMTVADSDLNSITLEFTFLSKSF